MDEANEIEQLRARVAELETELQDAESNGTPGAATKTPGRSAGWAVLSVVLIVLGVVLAPLSVASVWASRTLSDTDHYVETVAPIADNPDVQQALTDKITSVIFERLDVQGITSDALTSLSQQPNVPPRVATALPGLAVPIANGVESFTRDQVSKLVASPQFAQIWDQVNRVAHEQVVGLLEGKQGGAVTAQNGTITLNLAPIIQTVKERLVAQGFGLASNIPAVDTSFVLVQSQGITKAQNAFSLLNTLGVWLPFVALALLAGGVFAARDRRRALIGASLGVAGAMVFFGAGLALARVWYVGNTPANILTEDAAGYVFDTLVRFLRTALRALAVLGLVVALAAFLAGPSTVAVWTRATAQGGIGSARSSAEAAGWNPGRVGAWTYDHRRALWVGVAVLWALVLMLWQQPTLWVVIWTAVAAVVLLGVIEFLGRPPAVAGTGTPSLARAGEPALAGVGVGAGGGTGDTTAMPVAATPPVATSAPNAPIPVTQPVATKPAAREKVGGGDAPTTPEPASNPEGSGTPDGDKPVAP